MIISYLRTKLRKKTLFARQSWAPKDNSYISNKFNELKLEYRCYGNKNPNKFFYIIRRSPGAGFFSNLNFVIHNLLICDQLKMIPVVDMENYQTYYNCKIKIKNSYNSWNYYFEPVSKYSLKDVYQSKNVVICDSRTSSEGYNKERYIYNFKFFNGFQFLDSRHKKIMKKYIKIKKDIVKDAEKIYKQFNKKKVIGICFRGSDSKKKCIPTTRSNL